MDCHNCGTAMTLVSTARYDAGEQFTWSHNEALWECPSCGKTEMVMNGIREPHAELW